jgi:hypothetical protein
MPGTWKFPHRCRREYLDEFPRDLVSPWRAGRAEEQQHGLPDVAGGAGQVGGGKRSGFARQGRSNDGEHIPPAWCIAQRLHLGAVQADDLKAMKAQSAHALGPDRVTILPPKCLPRHRAGKN